MDAPQLAPMVVPFSVVILIGSFLVQRKGAGFIGSIFGPAMLLWFAIIRHSRPRRDLSRTRHLGRARPLSALSYLLYAGPGIGFAVLGARLPGGHGRRGDVR